MKLKKKGGTARERNLVKGGIVGLLFATFWFLIIKLLLKLYFYDNGIELRWLRDGISMSTALLIVAFTGIAAFSIFIAFIDGVEGKKISTIVKAAGINFLPMMLKSIGIVCLLAFWIHFTARTFIGLSENINRDIGEGMILLFILLLVFETKAFFYRQSYVLEGKAVAGEALTDRCSASYKHKLWLGAYLQSVFALFTWTSTCALLIVAIDHFVGEGSFITMMALIALTFTLRYIAYYTEKFLHRKGWLPWLSGYNELNS